MCRKEVVDPISDRTFFHITTHDLCESCKDAMDDRLKPLMRSHVPFTEEWYNQTVESLIQGAIQKGRF